MLKYVYKLYFLFEIDLYCEECYLKFIFIMSYFLLDEKLTLAQYIGFTIIVMASVALSIKGKKIPKLNKAFYYMMFFIN